MSDEDAFTVKNVHLDQLIKALKNNMSKVRVGILGTKNARSGGGSNASIGALHEFGEGKMPQRSFLRVPISEHLQKNLEKSNMFTQDELLEVVKEGTMLPWLKKLAVIGEKIVLEAFATGGDGKWPKWKTKGYKNNTGQILVDTTQLRDSITSDIKNG